MKQRFVRIPVPPTKAMLEGMATATFLCNGSDLEMERRFNGMLRALDIEPSFSAPVKKKSNRRRKRFKHGGRE